MKPMKNTNSLYSLAQAAQKMYVADLTGGGRELGRRKDEYLKCYQTKD